MKLYFERTNGNNAVLIEKDGMVVSLDCAPKGVFYGVDLYSEYTENKLRELCREYPEVLDAAFDNQESVYEIDEIKEEIEEMSTLIYDSDK